MTKKISSKDRKSRGTYHLDGLVNILSGLGTAKDKSASNRMNARSKIFDFTTWENFYTEFWLARKVVDTPAKDMTRKWRRFLAPGVDPDKIAQLVQEEKRLKVKKKMREAVKWSRLYGGGVLIPVFSDSKFMDQSKPLNVSKIGKGTLVGFNVVDASLIFPSQTVTIDPTADNYLKPETYTLAGAKTPMHHSWVIRVEGLELPRRQSQMRKYWGQSLISLLLKCLMDALTSSDGGASLLHEMNIDVVSVKGLSTALASGQEEAIKTRFETYSMLKSIWNMVIVDSEEQYDRKAQPFTNLDKVIEKFYDLVAGATEIPVTKLLGQSARGLNATGEGEQKDYYDFISAEQEQTMEQPLLAVDQMMMMSLWGEIPEGITYEFVSLGQLTDKEQAEIENLRATRDQTYLMNGIVTEWQVAAELMENGTYDNIDQTYIDKLKRLAEEVENEEDEELVEDADDSSSAAKGKDKAEPRKAEQE